MTQFIGLFRTFFSVKEHYMIYTCGLKYKGYDLSSLHNMDPIQRAKIYGCDLPGRGKETLTLR
jgi:hypothetical protein